MFKSSLTAGVIARQLGVSIQTIAHRLLGRGGLQDRHAQGEGRPWRQRQRRRKGRVGLRSHAGWHL
jgi:hypothetical protein